MQTTQDIYKRHIKPTKVIIAGLLVIGLFFGGIGTMASTMPFSGALILPGVVKVSQERKTVQHLEGGIVETIQVREGDHVTKGQVLIRLKSIAVVASSDLIRGRLLAKSAEIARLKAQQAMADQLTWPEEISANSDDLLLRETCERELQVFNSARQVLISRIAMNSAQVKQLREKIAGAEEELSAQARIIETIQEEINAKASLLEERYIDKTNLLNLERGLAEHQGEKGRLRQSIAEYREQIEQVKLSTVTIQNDYKQTAAENLRQVMEEIFELKEQLKPREDARDRLSIRAPVTGVVVNLKVHSENGAVIRPGESILEIVPENADLVIEARLRQDQITKIFLDQVAKVQLNAFNRITTPPVDGKVVYISADQITEQTNMGLASFFIVQIRVNEATLGKKGAYLFPGMPATCFVTTEERTFVQYLMEPILLNLDKSLRESL